MDTIFSSGGVFFFFSPFKFQLLCFSFLEVRVLVRVIELDFIVYMRVFYICIYYVFYSICTVNT